MFRAEFHQKWTKKPPLHTQTFARSRVSHLVDQKHLKIEHFCLNREESYWEIIFGALVAVLNLLRLKMHDTKHQIREWFSSPDL